MKHNVEDEDDFVSGSNSNDDEDDNLFNFNSKFDFCNIVLSIKKKE